MMSDKSTPTPETTATPDEHELGYAYGKAAFQNGQPRKIRHDHDFAAFLHTNKLSLTTTIRQAWLRGWNNANEAAALRAKMDSPPTP